MSLKLVEMQHFVALGTAPSLLIEKALPEKSLMVMVGEPYVGKSLIALDLAVAVAFGGKALGKFQARQANVLYVAADAPTWYGAWQAASIVRGHGIHEVPEGRMWFAPPGQGRYTRVLESDQETREFIEAVESVNPELVVLDTLRKMHTQDENSSGVMTQVIDRCRMLNAAGMGVILLHHAVKNGGEDGPSAAYRGRGSTVVPGEVDVNWLMEKRPAAVRVTVAKGRGASLDGPFDIAITNSGTPENPSLKVHWTVPAPDLPKMAPVKRGRPRKQAEWK